MELRKLNGNDIFKVSRILKKINLDVSSINLSDKKQETVGIEIVKMIVENSYLAQEEINDFLGGLCGCSDKEFGEKDLDEIVEVIAKFKEMVKGTNFFITVSKLMK
ncbi:hypothetical protein [Romboutsia sp.]|uniref:hypothetical protein n=1 Tax=Romboutsia sp. TaxID=1965302 RepID=UPI002D1B1600|nr:hypothetical protein [Romboutsia sp.]HSQ88099.1 hypothetical protein [Romboutsia sp.]